MKFVPLFILGIVLMGCKSNKTTTQTMLDRIESYLQSKGMDLSTFEFVSLTDLDTVSEKNYIDMERGGLSLALMNKAGRIKMMDSVEIELNKALKRNPNDNDAIANLKTITSSKSSLAKKQHELDSLTAAIKPEMAHSIKYIGVKYAFNKKDAAGTKVPHKYYIKFDEKLNVIDVIELNN